MSQNLKGGLTEEQRRLIEEHRWLINRCHRKLSARLPRSLAGQVDVCDVTTDALMEAARSFSRQHGPFPAWVSRILNLRWKDALLRAQRRNQAQINGWCCAAWIRRSNKMMTTADDQQQRQWVVDHTTNTTMAHLLGSISSYSRDVTLSPERLAILQQLSKLVMGLLGEMRTDLTPAHAQILQLTDLKPGDTIWVDVASDMGLDKRTVRKRHAEALAWLIRRLRKTRHP